MDKVEKVGTQTLVRDSKSGRLKHGTTEPDASTLKRVRRNMETREYFDKHAKQLINLAIDKAKEGSEPMLKLCIDKIIPNKKYDTIKIQMYGQLSKMGDVVKMSSKVVESLCAGIISPEQAKTVCDVLDMHSSTLEKVEISDRLDKLEELLETKSTQTKVEYLGDE